jgi:CheY-like chemotaxis protein
MNPDNNIFYYSKSYLMKPKLKCVMVIDDDEPTNFFNHMLVEKSGCAEHIKVIQSGQEALEYLSQTTNDSSTENDLPSPDLIFLDINMPAMNGWEFLEKYKKLSKEQKANIVVVMLTTSLFPEDKLKASELPEISDFENKPLTAEKLDKVLRKHFAHISCV